MRTLFPPRSSALKNLLAMLIAAVSLVSIRLEGKAQAVLVTLSLDTNRIAVGETTLLHVFAQIAPAFRTNSDRIFSWYLDLVHTNGQTAQGVYPNLTKPTSDNDPRTSSSGTQSGSNLRAIYDTFLNRPSAGKEAPILLFTVPVRGMANGAATFRVEKGSGVNLAHDFMVAPAGGGDPFTGGDYSQALVTLTVGGDSVAGPRMNISHAFEGTQNRLAITFPTTAGRNYTVEFQDALGLGGWQTLPGAPHNNGTAFDTNSVPIRFYRVRVN